MTNWQGFLRDLTEAEDHFLTSSGETWLPGGEGVVSWNLGSGLWKKL
jgi:hypothetical protein